MSSFIAAGQTITPPQTQTTIVNDGFYPDIDLARVRTTMRLDGTVTDDRLSEALIAAVLEANAELAALKQRVQQAGHTKLADYPADKINGTSTLLHLYLRAVSSLAKADLIEKYTDYDTTATSLDDKKLVSFLAQAPEEHRRNARWAIADMLGRTRVTVELI